MTDKFKYIQFVLTPRVHNPRVKFITEVQEGENPISLSLDKFISFLLGNFYIRDKDKLLFDLHAHKIIYLDNTTGEHSSKNIYENVFEADFNTLLKLNEKKEVISKIDNGLLKTKNSINYYSDKVRDFFK